MVGSPVCQYVVFQEILTYGNSPFKNVKPESSGLKTTAAIGAGEMTLKSLRKPGSWQETNLWFIILESPKESCIMPPKTSHNMGIFQVRP